MRSEMFSHSSDIRRESVIDADVCIIGAGCAGITLATELNGSPLKVILLESGDLEYDEKTQSLYQGENISANPLKLEDVRLRYFGGSTNHWHGMCHPLNEIDMLPRKEIAYPGWPITLNDLIPFYVRAQKVCQLGPFVYDDENYWRQQMNFSPLLSGNLLRTSFFQLSPPTRFGAVYREVLKKSANVEVILNANALELESSGDADHVTQVRVAHINGNTFWVKAKKFVLSAGGLETPRILLLSNKIQKKGLGNGHDLVGRYYMDHLANLRSGTLQFIADQSKYPWYFKLGTKVNHLPDTTVGVLLTPSTELIKKEGITNFRIMLLPTPEEKGIDSVKSIISGIKSGHIPDDLGGHIKNVLSEIDSVTNLAFKNIFHTNKNLLGAREKSTAITRADIDLNMEQLPNRDSKVSLSGQKDVFGQNRLKLDWKISEMDKKTAGKALETIALECGKYNLGRVRISDSLKQDTSFETSWHHMGTTRMSVSPTDGVVNVDCKVHGVDNLFIASSSVFTTGGWANPTLTITALSIRLADHLKTLFS
ncbi:MAG: GMC oxidoreductase [Methylobacter sp.]|nr:MAG: GMC oxidoreductase [Methylobacter sp.]